MIRARKLYSDGVYKCPRTCRDSDLLVADFNGCKALAGDGYCNGGAISMGRSKMTIKTDLCPKSCNNCAEVMQGSTIVGSGGHVSGGAGCADKTVKINGKSCPQIAKE